MKIPKKINPDNLKHTIIQVLYNPAIPHELFVGSFNHHFSDSFKFVGAPPKRNELKLSGSDGLVMESLQRGFFLDHTEQVKIDVGDAGIVFNSFKGYVGWDNYFPIISSTVDKLFRLGLIKEITRIGIRYISQFDNVNLTDNLKMNLEINVVNESLESTQVRTEYFDETYKVILTLINKIKKAQDESKQENLTSIVDIDVIQTFEGLVDPEKALEVIENGHRKQKTTFFSLLRPEFLESLKPEY